MASDPRTPEQIREHYEIEKALAARLRSAPKAARSALYSELYDELFRRVPLHPLLRRKEDPGEVALRTRWKLDLIARFLEPDTVFLEIGPGDCSLAFAVAARVRKVWAVDVSAEITRSVAAPPNFELVISDGCSIPVPPGSVTVAASHQLMEHLHPDDAEAQLESIVAALAPGGVYLCTTPNRLSGPHDVSRFYDEVATGFHLREYTLHELRRSFLAAGFSRVHAYAGGRGVHLRSPVGALLAFERMVESLPRGLARRLARSLPGQALLGVTIAGIR